MKKQNLLTLLLASILLVGCQGESISPSTSDSSSQGGSETSTSTSTSEPSESTSTGSDSTSTGSDSISEVQAYSLSYLKGDNDPSDLAVQIYYESDFIDITNAAHDFNEGESLSLSITTQTTLSIASVTLNGERLSRNSSGLYHFLMPSQDSQIAITFAESYSLSAAYSIDGIAEMVFFEQTSFDPSDIDITSAPSGSTIFAYLSFNIGYAADDFIISTKNGDVELTALADQKTLGRIVYSFTMPSNDVSLSVTISAPTDNWYSYFLSAENLALESQKKPKLSMAEIDQYVPFLSRDIFEFSGVTTYDYATSFIWILTTSNTYSSRNDSGLVAEKETIETALGQVLLENGWSYSYMYVKDITEDFQLQLQIANVTNADGSYSAGLRFDSYRTTAPTNWIATFNGINAGYEETESYGQFIMSAQEIQDNIPFFSYDFTGLDYTFSHFDLAQTLGTWVLTARASDTSTSALTEAVAAIDAAAKGALTTAAGWTTGQLSDGTTAYSKQIEGKYIWVYAALLNGTTPALFFDGDIIHTTWYSYFTRSDLLNESYYFMAAYADTIDREFPFWDSEYAQITDGFDSALSLYDIAWAIGTEDISSVQDLNSTIAAMESELVINASTAGWTETTVTYDGESHTAYSHVSETNGETYYFYVRGSILNTTSGVVYGSYYIFDCAVSSWENYFKDEASKEETANFAMSLEEMKNYVPHWDSQYEDQFVTSTVDSKLTSGYSAWAIGVSNLDSTTAQSNAISALNSELSTYLTNSSLGEEYNYSLVTVGEGASAFSAYYLLSDYNYTGFYIYVEGYSETIDGSTVYGARIVFDAEHTWGSLTTQSSISIAESSYYSNNFSVNYATIAANVPYVSGVSWSGFDYMNSSINSGSSVWYAYYNSTILRINSDKAAILAELQSALTDFTYDEANSQFSKVLSSGETLVAQYVVNSETYQICLIFDIAK